MNNSIVYQKAKGKASTGLKSGKNRIKQMKI